MLCADEAYVLRGTFDPEATLRSFNDAIEAASTDGFTGFRAAAEMSWALARVDPTPSCSPARGARTAGRIGREGNLGAVGM